MEIKFDVHYNLLQKTFTYERVLCDLLHFLYYKLHVTVHFGYILMHNISLYISMDTYIAARTKEDFLSAKWNQYL